MAIIAVFYTVAWIGIVVFTGQEMHVILSFSAIFIDIIAVIIFILPPLGVHYILKSTKQDINNMMNDNYEQKKIHAIVQYHHSDQTEAKLIKDIQFLKNVVDETKSLKTWPIEPQAVAKLSGSIFPTLTSFVIQMIHTII